MSKRENVDFYTAKTCPSLCGLCKRPPRWSPSGTRTLLARRGNSSTKEGSVASGHALHEFLREPLPKKESTFIATLPNIAPNLLPAGSVERPSGFNSWPDAASCRPCRTPRLPQDSLRCYLARESHCDSRSTWQMIRHLHSKMVPCCCLRQLVVGGHDGVVLSKLRRSGW